jgi:hypothetical protein
MSSTLDRLRFQRFWCQPGRLLLLLGDGDQPLHDTVPWALVVRLCKGSRPMDLGIYVSMYCKLSLMRLVLRPGRTATSK